MNDHLPDLDARLRALDAAMADVVARLGRLEAQGADASPSAGRGPAPVSPPVERSSGSFDMLALVGRTLIVLGGAYLLRALTESGQLPNGVGVGLGLFYAVAWLVAANRAAGAGRPASALVHGIAAVIIGLPLVWEASTKFALLGPGSSAAAVGLLTAAALYVAARSHLQGLAGVAMLGALFASLALAFALDNWVPFTILASALGVAAWRLGEGRLAWVWLRWPAAGAAALLSAGLVMRATALPPRESLTAAVVAHLLLPAAYLGAFGWRTLGRAEPVRAFEIVMSAAVVGLGLGSALAETSAAGATTSVMMLGLGSLLASSAGYGLALAIVRRRQGRGPNYLFYTSLALVLLIIGCGALLDGGALALTVAALAIVATGLGWRGTLPTLTLHGAILASTAAVASGWLPVVSVWAGTAGAWPDVPGLAWVALAAISACLLTPRPTTWDPPAVLASIGRGLLAVAFAAGASTAVLVLLGPAVAGSPPEPGILASTRTVVLSAAAVILALVARRTRLVEFGWLVYPLLGAGGLKLVFEDFRLSQPSTLFVALAAYGAALVIGPRLMPARRHH